MKNISKLLFLLVFFAGTNLYSQMDQDALKPFKDQQILDDLIVDGSACVGLDCVNGENFGFSTIRVKENNVRIEFTDTSTSASFPSNDWMLEANSSSNGGSNHFAIVDISGGRTPFLVEAGAPTSSLYVDDGGRIGFGTATPVVELHVKDGDTPTLRLEQDGSSGFTAQTWDLASNETNFFIRDATNGSRLPFKIRPNAPTNSFYIDTDGDIGLGDASPDAKLDIESGDLLVTNGKVEINGVGNTSATHGLKVENSDGDVGLYVGDDGNVGVGTSNPSKNLHVKSSSGITTVLIEDDAINSSPSFRLVNDAIEYRCYINGPSDVFVIRDQTNNVTPFKILPNSLNNNFVSTGTGVGIGTAFPGTLLEVNGSTSKPGGGSWAVASDARLKKNVKHYSEGLETLLKFNPVTFQYNGKGGISDTESTYVGLIAQEAQKVAPYMVNPVDRATIVKNGNQETVTYDKYLNLDPSAIPYMLINAVKEQQAQMDAKDEKIETLESKVDNLQDALFALIERLDGEVASSAIDVLNEEDVTLSIASLPYLKQNVPNPYDEQTSINYFVPESAEQATINFYDNQGRLLKSQVLGQKGEGKLNVKNKDLPSGTYVYSLIVDGKMVSSKKMSVQ